jgi:hypothetical protein
MYKLRNFTTTYIVFTIMLAILLGGIVYYFSADEHKLAAAPGIVIGLFICAWIVFRIVKRNSLLVTPPTGITVYSYKNMLNNKRTDVAIYGNNDEYIIPLNRLREDGASLRAVAQYSTLHIDKDLYEDVTIDHELGDYLIHKAAQLKIHKGFSIASTLESIGRSIKKLLEAEPIFDHQGKAVLAITLSGLAEHYRHERHYECSAAVFTVSLKKH